jgi:hypothetical protein
MALIPKELMFCEAELQTMYPIIGCNPERTESAGRNECKCEV